MKSTLYTNARQAVEADAPVPYLRTAAVQPASDDDSSSDLHAAMALQRALACTQRELFAALQKVDLLVDANARLRERAVAHESMSGRHVAPRALPDGVRRSEIANLVPLLREAPGIVPLGTSTRMTDFSPFGGLDPHAMLCVERLLTKRVRLRKGDVLYRVGGGFSALYAIRTGSCKTLMLARDGHDQVAGYYIAGEIVGLDGIGTELHECQATAMEDTEVCPLPFDELENLARQNDQFGHNLHKLLTQESARARVLMIALGTMSAEQRVALFLLDLSQRYRARGYSSCEFVLRMTREEIGSYLGLKLETVSRLFSRMQREGLIQVEGRAVKLLDRVALNRLVEGGA